MTVAAGLGVPPRDDSHCKFSGVPNILRAPLCCLLLINFSLPLWLLRLTHAYSLSLHLHVCLPAASLSMKHVLTVQWHSMLPCRPPGVSDELWALELPSILGVAHSDFPHSPEPSSPSALPAHTEPGPEHPVSPRPDASPAGPHTTSHRHVPGTSSYEPHSTSADVFLLDSSDTEEPHSPDTQVPATLAVDSYVSEWNVPSPDLKLVFDLLRLSLRIYGAHLLLHLSWWLNHRRMHCFTRVTPPLMILRLFWTLCRAINTPSAENNSARWATLANAPSLRVPLLSRSAQAFNATPRRSLLWYRC